MNDEPCGWTAEPCEDCCEESITAVGPEQWAILQQLAVWILWRATGGVYGLCENTYRPCRRNCDGSFGWPIGAPFIPWRINDQWINLSCSTCPGECGCGGAVSEIRLPQVAAVTAITVDGVDLVPEDTVAVYDRWRIVRIDGEQWPGCQNLASKGGVGTWSITVSQGLPIPPGGSMLAGTLACELAKMCVGASDCRLPSNWSSITRQGLTIVGREAADIAMLRTGIDEIDLWIEAARATQFRGPSITSPDRPKPARMTWPVAEVVGP